MPTPDKNETPPSTLEAMGKGLSVAEGPGPIERFGPLIALLLYLMAIGVLAFDLAPNPDILLGVVALLGPIVGGWAAKLGATG